MASFGTYYIDAPTFSTATSVFSDAALTTYAPDGFYSDGVIFREQAAGVLSFAATCPSCAGACAGAISGTGAQGIYKVSYMVGTGTGAVKIMLTPTGAAVPTGIKATYNTFIYNEVSTANFGYKVGTGSLPIFLGDTAADCGIVAGSPYTLNEFNYSGGAFVATGNTIATTVVAGQMQTTAGVPGACIMYIPKTIASPTTLTIEMTSPCGTPPAWQIRAECPTALTGFSVSTLPQATSAGACGQPFASTYYNGAVTGSGGNPALHDWVFLDANAQQKLSAATGPGYYRWDDGSANGAWFQLDSNSVIISVGSCP
jgi:hypothetical protein